MRLGCLGFWLNCCLLAGCLGLWLNCCLLASCLGLWIDCCLLAGCLGLWLGGFARLGSLARLADIWTAPGSLSRFTSKKFLRFLISQELFLMRGPSRPIEALFTAQSGLTRELLTSKFHIDPRTSLQMPPELFIPLLSALVPDTTSLLHKIILYQSLHISHIQWIFLRLKS